MSGSLLLDWAAQAVSLFNTILLLWLGLTVLLDAERRTLGVWLVGEGLLMGAAFFVSHSAILAQGLLSSQSSLSFWWHVGWAPVVLSPLAWYLVILWYAGYWDDPRSGLYRRHAPWFGGVLVFTAVLVLLLLFANPLPTLTYSGAPGLEEMPSLAGIPWLVLLYPAYIALCVLLALDALLRPGPSGRLMGDEARRRARPWLVASTLVLLLVSLLVALALFWAMLFLRRPFGAGFLAELSYTLTYFDLVIAVLIAAAVLLIGQSVVSYEVFTGKALPRRGLRRLWRNAVLLALGVSLPAALGLTVSMRPVYTLLLTILLSTAFYALLGWRSFRERDQAIRQIRPLVASQKLYEQILSQPGTAQAELSFRELCAGVLGARAAAFLPQGGLTPLLPDPLLYPPSLQAELPALHAAAGLAAEGSIPLRLEPAASAGMAWALPLFTGRGLAGVLLLGEKEDGGFYSQEEMEIARAGGERLADLLASAGLARRLADLQRQRMAETQVLDRRARRVLHDEVLPQLHTALLSLSAAQPGAEVQAASAALAESHRRVSDLLREMPLAPPAAVARQGLAGALRQLVAEEFAGAFGRVDWEVDPAAEEAARRLPSLHAETLFFAGREALRNAARHARPADGAAPSLTLRLQRANGLELSVEDNGAGMGAASQGAGGSGQGLALHSTLLAVLGGALLVESVEGKFTRVTLRLPLEE